MNFLIKRFSFPDFAYALIHLIKMIKKFSNFLNSKKRNMSKAVIESRINKGFYK